MDLLSSGDEHRQKQIARGTRGRGRRSTSESQCAPAAGRPRSDQHSRGQVAEALVIVKFQRFLQSAQAHVKKLKCPLLASAHDYIEYIVEILPDGGVRL